MSKKSGAIWSHQLISRVIDSMADGVFTLDGDGLIVSWNRSMERISGYSAEEALGKTCALLNCSRCFGKTCPADIGKCRIFEKGSSGAKECLLQHKNGYDIPVIKHASVVNDEDGRILGVVETITDMTELNEARKKAEEASLRLGEIHRLDNIIGQSRVMRDVFTAIKMAAASDATVLVQGESGTGKELIAGAIHFNSERKKQQLVTVNCSALPENLLESELFGHVRGAYTGAIRARTGRFEEAEGGTVFLDEIAELSPLIQVKLLRVLQEREIERVGESKKRKINIRIVAATHQDLYAMVKAGRFREDLYYRLNVFPITIPPLRQRKEDIPLLLSYFIRKMNTRTGKNIVDASREVMRILMEYDWPGNVRELENAVEHAFVLCTRDRVEHDDLPGSLFRHHHSVQQSESESRGAVQPKRRKSIPREDLLKLLQESGWNKAEVARRIGVSHTSVWKYMKKYKIPLQREEG
ncbi:MAG: sigma 54-interacting transcriptional regulator [Desulfopila sp.]|jgi:PAS domain S-box-containing protein|nr:sigma 54-interacting transcriptional regulator [Desulfopila sp.]